LTQLNLAIQLSAAVLLTLWVYYVTSGISRRYYESALRAVKDEGMASTSQGSSFTYWPAACRPP